MFRKEIIPILCVQQWEKCKGELRALIALNGAYHYDERKDDNWETLDVKIQEFITDIEDNELYI